MVKFGVSMVKLMVKLRRLSRYRKTQMVKPMVKTI